MDTAMMGRKSKQLCMIMIDMEELIPKNHLVRKIIEAIDFDFIYTEAAEYYSNIGRPSIDPLDFPRFGRRSNPIIIR
ncbi:hypothetical protein [Treponema primitia]|uniref:hypothetical protein n=1 Tax=Treponema primitia TaxID=88058 RepID=UPI003981614A